DVAHNPHAAAYLARRLKTLAKTGRRCWAVIGMLHDKDVAHNPHAAAYLARRLKTLAKTGRRCWAVIGM
ncbi:hypothetical protein CQA48_30630, partial [Klebsiella pneumoniae]